MAREQRLEHQTLQRESYPEERRKVYYTKTGYYVKAQDVLNGKNAQAIIRNTRKIHEQLEAKATAAASE